MTDLLKILHFLLPSSNVVLVYDINIVTKPIFREIEELRNVVSPESYNFNKFRIAIDNG